MIRRRHFKKQYFRCGFHDVVLSLTQQHSNIGSYINFIYRQRLLLKLIEIKCMQNTDAVR